jgi:DNA-binding helix-hairpin-helix protein with protein kinase domain
LAPTLRDSTGGSVLLGARLGRGGEGEVFEVQGQPGLCAKVFLPGRRSRAKADKLRAMVASPPPGAHDRVDGQPVLTWPRSLLLDDRGDVAGYLMDRVAPRDFAPWFQLTASSRRSGLGRLEGDHLLLLGMRLCHVVRTLHRFGHAVGDLNDRNVLVGRRLTPLLMDTDSFQVPRRIGHHASVVGDALYWPPELLDVDLAAYRGSRVHGDRYALGVLLFQLLMDGLRPYQSRGSLVDGLETLADKTRAGHYPWAKPRPGVLEPPAGAPDYAALPKPLRKAFERCFVAGHAHPARRPTADEWYDALAEARRMGMRVQPATSRRAARPSRPARKAVPARAVALAKRTGRGPPLAPLPPTPLRAPTPRAADKRPGASRSPPTPMRPKAGWLGWTLMAAATGVLALTAF